MDGPISPRSTRARVLIVAALAVVAFAIWAVSVVGRSARLRGELREAVSLRGEIEDAVHDLQTHHPGDPAIGAALDALTRAAHRAHRGTHRIDASDLVSSAASLRTALQQARQGERPTNLRQDVFAAARRLTQRLRAESDRVSGALDDSSQAMQALALTSIGLAALALALAVLEQRSSLRRSELDERLAAALSEAERARAEAQGANRAKSEFLATVSHEIRTPLTSVLGTVELLAGSTLTPSQREYLAVIGSGSEAVLRLVSDVLDLARIEAGRLEIRPREVDLAAFCDGIALLFAGPAEGKGLALSVVVGPTVPAKLQVDEDRLRQILVNLVGNALKFTTQGEVTVRLDAASGRLRFLVRDTGPGVSEEMRARLFAPFEQGVPARGSHGGSGLGLAIARRLADGLGGSLSLEAAEGACFALTLPMEPGMPAEVPMPGRLLVYGDDPLCLAARDQLTAWGAVLVGPGEEHDLVLLGRDARPQSVQAPAIRLLPLASPDPDPRALRGPVRPLGLRAALLGSPPDLGAFSPSNVARRVLVVDDQPSNRRVLGDLLRRMGHATETAPGGIEGVERARAERFDVVIMDLDMPDLDGIGATRALREDGGASSQAAILGLTGHATEEARAAGMEAGMDEWIAKPVRLADLSEAVERAIRRHRAAG
jgi:signal transduction histidine kinase/ActR/RegA family two-component response regulator